MNKQKFRVGTLDPLTCPPGKSQHILYDAETPGLGFRVTPQGARSFIFETRLGGRTLRLTIGDRRTWDISAAQVEATRLKRLTDQGIDPRDVVREQRQREAAARAEAARKAEADRVEAERRELLVSTAWSDYVAHHQKRWGARHLADHWNLSQVGGGPKKRGNGLTVQGVLRPLLDMRMADINATTLAQWQNTEAANRANNARQGFELFRTFWKWSATRPEYKDVVDVSAVEDRDVRNEVPSRRTKRHDVLERSHLATWFAAVRGLNNPSASAYLQALLLTGARREEMASLQWKDVDFQWGGIWVKDKVLEEGRKIPLTPYLASVLSALPRQNQWVFSSKTAKNGRIADPRIPHNRALSVAGLPHVTLHGLRRTFASLAEWVEMPTGVVAQIMGHAPNATAEKHYINRPLDLLAVWHGKYEAWILKQAKVAFKARKRTRKTVQAEARERRKSSAPLRLVSAN